MNEELLNKIGQMGKPIIDMIEDNKGKIILIGLAGLVILYLILR